MSDILYIVAIILFWNRCKALQVVNTYMSKETYERDELYAVVNGQYMTVTSQ